MNKPWRLPTKNELYSIVDSEIAKDMKNIYWSSTTYAFHTEYAWYVGFGHGHVSGSCKLDSYHVRAVRSWNEQPVGNGFLNTDTIQDEVIYLPKTRFTVQSDCIRDWHAGLEWQLEPFKEPMTWDEAVKACEELNSLGIYSKELSKEDMNKGRVVVEVQCAHCWHILSMSDGCMNYVRIGKCCKCGRIA